MTTWSIPVGRIFGVNVRLHVTFLFLLMVVWFTESAAPAGVGPERGLALLGIIFGSVVLHELGHALVAMHEHVTVRAIILLPIGGVTLMDDVPYAPSGAEGSSEGEARWRRDLRIGIAGPLVNLVIAALAAAVLKGVAPEVVLWKHPLVYSGALLRSLVWANLSLGLFNLLPAYPMDGGRVLRAWFARRMPLVDATRRAVNVGQAFSLLFILVGFWNTWLMLIGLFLFIAAQLEERSVVFQSALDGVRLSDIMLTDFATLSPADTLEDALAKAVHSLQEDFPVVRGTDLVGVISRRGILRALRSEGNAYVQLAMERAFEIAGPNESLANAFRRLTARGLSLITVVDEGRLIGIVTLQNVVHSMSMLAESRRSRRSTE
jgi:Zn-dependent protease/CBS domain-containing protein